MPDNGGQPGATGDVRLTYQELGARLRISAEAARTLTRRRGWRRLAPNRKGAPAIVVVPVEELDAEDWRQDRGAPPDSERSSPDGRADMAEQRAVEAGQRADAALAVADRALAQLAEAQARADRLDLLVETERGKIVAIEAKAAAERETFREQLAAAQEAAKESSAEVLTLAKAVNELTEANDARRARGLLARLRAAWRGE